MRCLSARALCTKWLPVHLWLALVGGSGCGSTDPSDESPVTGPGMCDTTALTSRLQALATAEDFAFYVESPTGASLTVERGAATMETAFESASTSKWVAAATILWLVDQGVLALTDHPQDYLSDTQWPVAAGSALSNITLSHLLSFTSGLNEEVACTNLPNSDFFTCVRNVALRNADSAPEPGTTFSYGSNHLQVAAAMAVAATEHSGWSSVFDDFKRATGLFPTSQFNLPSTTNPRVAGGMTWTATEYIAFIRAYRDGDFYDDGALLEQARSNQVGNASIAKSPAFAGLGEDWRYGYGQWLECHSDTFEPSCADEATVSSPGAYGAYPWLAWSSGAFGIIARQGNLGTFTEGYAIFDQARDLVEEWIRCEASAAP